MVSNIRRQVTNKYWILWSPVREVANFLSLHTNCTLYCYVSQLQTQWSCILLLICFVLFFKKKKQKEIFKFTNSQLSVNVTIFWVLYGLSHYYIPCIYVYVTFSWSNAFLKCIGLKISTRTAHLYECYEMLQESRLKYGTEL